MTEKYNIIWMPKALDSFEDIVDQIISRWNLKTAIEFDNRIKELISNLQQNAKFCPKSKVLKLRKCVVHKNISLIYQVHNNTIHILILVFNRGDHKY